MSQKRLEIRLPRIPDGILYIQEMSPVIQRRSRANLVLFVNPVVGDASLINIPGLLFAAMMTEDENSENFATRNSSDYTQVVRTNIEKRHVAS